MNNQNFIKYKEKSNEIKCIDVLIYMYLLKEYVNKLNKKQIIKNANKISNLLDKICNDIDLLDDNQKVVVADELENIYKVLNSISNKLAPISQKEKYLVSLKKFNIDKLQEQCAMILIKMGFQNKLEILDIYGILKIFIFEKKDFEIVRMLFSKVTSLVHFEEIFLIINKIFDKCMTHLLDDTRKFEYYRNVFEYLINLGRIKISKYERKQLLSKIHERKLEIKNNVSDKHLVNKYIEMLDTMIFVIDKNQTQRIKKSFDEINKKHGISVNFNENIFCRYINHNYKNSYVDVTDKYTITIDCKGTLKIDDAFSFETTNDGYVLEIYVTDLTPYIDRNSFIDGYAKERAFTINLPKNYISMIPSPLVNDVVSLKQGYYRCVIAHRLEFSKNMDLIDFNIYNALVKIDKNYNYEMIEKIINKGKNKQELEFFKNVFEFQDKLNKLNLFSNDYHEIKQLKRLLDSNYTSCEYRDNSISSKLISSFMVLTNYFVSKKFDELNFPFLYCTNKSMYNKEIIDKIKLEATDSEKVSEILKMINENYYSSKYSLKNEGHQGLGLDSYCHATNPIRNYASLTIQRLEQDFLFNDNISDLLIYAWEDYLYDLIPELNQKKEKYKYYSSDYYKFYNSNK